MLRIYPNEQFKEINFPDRRKRSYAVSNHGRFVSFKEKIEDGQLMKCSLVDGYRSFRYKRVVDGKICNKHLFIFRLVAEYFLPKTSDEQVFVLHLDHSRSNDYVKNLQWATKSEMVEHYKKSPHVIKARKKLVESARLNSVRKLTSTQVILIKKIVLDPTRKVKLKIIARQFGVSEMQIRRIKSGENWSHVKVEVKARTKPEIKVEPKD